ncbi:hypothetical protein [Streptacidiphilus jiangxiensis]|uniref:DnaK suppressor protein n=1 Tax=Streptacidiphilus jiangxiensis TaxID=235985 RepID=A0A1H7I289_STRJI|nr:hypothetical protein [Streptacidiphilus jiangxiensis]SEK55540.1 DnaK suppressor protein [Streptacidiphilus jiangxiensis]
MKAHFTKLLSAWKGELTVNVDRTVDQMKDEASGDPVGLEKSSLQLKPRTDTG